MKSFLTFPSLILLVFGIQAVPGPHCGAADLMSPQTAARLGLEVAWLRQLHVPAGADSIVDQQIFVHQEEPREFVEVVGKASEGEEPPVYFRIPTDQIGPDGQPIGKQEAERLAKREIRRLARKKLDLTIETRTIPRINLYTASTNGSIECRDAETGKPIWMTQVGNPRLNFGKMGIDDKFVTITNGGNLVKIDVTNGEPINSVRTSSTPMYGAINAGEFSLVPTIRNGVEGYPLADTTLDPFMEIVSGLALQPPTKSPTSTKIAWATDRGFVYVMELSGEPSVLFRLQCDGIVNGRIASAEGDRFFFGTEEGQVYGLKATRTGRVLWSQPYGEPFYKAPYLLDGNVYLTSVYGNLYAMDEQTGHPAWDRATPNVDEILGGFNGTLYVRLHSRNFAAIDAKTGETIDFDTSLMPGRMLVNRSTDRLYFVNSVGTVQCLRPIGKELATIRRSVDPGDTEEEEPSETTAPAKPAGKTNDPFGETVDPFGETKDPFGGDAAMNDDPFEAPAGGGDEDPFASPF